ncbi:MAG: prolyl oligopeptidase family serine peptidase [Candidatus Krumholzibacteriia bacterium]
MRHLILTTVCALLLLATAAATAVERTHDIVPEDYLDIATITSLAVANDGSQAVWTESRWGRGDEGRDVELWHLDLSGRTPKSRRLTFDSFGAAGPVWSPGGQWIYLLGRQKREGEAKPPFDGSRQVWRLRPDGRDLTPVTRAEGGVGLFCLTAPGDAVYYTVDQEHRDDEWRDLKESHDWLQYGHGITEWNPVRRLDLATWRDREVLPARAVIHDLALSPDGRRLAMITTTATETIFMEGWSQVDVLDLETGEIDQPAGADWRGDHPSPYGWLEELAWSGDSQALAFSVSFDGYASRIYVVDRSGGTWRRQLVDRPDPLNFSGQLRWQGRGRTLCYLGEAMGRIRVVAVEGVEDGGQGRTRELTPGEVVVEGYAMSADGKTHLALLGTTERLADIYRVDDGRLTPLTDVNPQVHTWKLPQISHITWTGGDGDEVGGILELPPGYDPATDGPLPLVMEIHGGPTSSTKVRLRLWIYGRALMPAKGYALLSPNYHGSLGYGDKFLEKLIGRENDLDVADLLSGVDHLIAQGIADPERLGVMGWSNGGYLTNCVITKAPGKFKAASSGAGVLDMVIQWAVEDTPGHVINFARGLPWDALEHYVASSPLYEMDRATTPTLIHVGGDDPRVPPAHSRGLYRALHHYLGVPCELIVYPGEPHGLTTARNRLAKMTWDLAWFDRYLLGHAETD